MAASPSVSEALLQGDVLQIGFHGVGKTSYPEDVPPAAVMRAIAQHKRIDLATEGVFWGDYCYFAGVIGEAFRFLEIGNLGKGQPGQALVEQYGDLTMAEMYRQAFEAAGLMAEMYRKPHLPEKSRLRRQIVESLQDRQTPVIGIGVFGPPEPFLITGYAEGGEILLGWSHFQGEKKNDPGVSFEPTGQFRLRNWYEAIDGVAIVTGTRDRPAARDIYRGALERGILALGTTERAGRVLGTAAMERWAARLENDALFAGFTDAQWQKANEEHGGTAGDLAERRALAASFLELAARFLPEAAEDLSMAGTAFMGAHDTVYEIWETVAKTGPFDPDLEKFKNPGRRQTMACLVRRLAQCDQRGLAFLERAMRLINRKDPGPAIAPDPVLDGEAVLRKAELAIRKDGASEEFLWAPENIALPNGMGMLQAFLGDPFAELIQEERAHKKLEYCLWMGFTGAAFGMLRDGPERSNLPLAFDALGYDYEVWMSKRLADETGLPCRQWGWDDNLRRRIFWNLRDRGLPVLLFNCGRWPDWWLVTRAGRGGAFQGYGGSSGEGYRPNEPLDHPKNPLRRIDLFEGIKGKETWTINVIAKRPAQRPPMRELYERAVAWGARKMMRQEMRLLDAEGKERVSTRPYHDWASMLRTDALFPPDDPATLRKRRNLLEGDEVELAERRYYGSEFLQWAAIRLERPGLNDAAAHFRAVNALMEQVWASLGGEGAPEAHLKLADRKTREAIAALLLEMEREDRAAAALLSR